MNWVLGVFFAVTIPALPDSTVHNDRTTQLVVVSTPSWESNTGTLQLYSLAHGKWIPFKKKVAVVLGRNGLAWGIGLHRRVRTGPQKIEGDGCSPAGIFALGPAFGYAGKPPTGVRLRYRGLTDRDYFVDDSLSRQYNRWVRLPGSVPNDPGQHWRSAERMRIKDSCYEYGIVVHHNMSPVTRGRGSAIFLHVWDGPGSTTAGCTAMPSSDIRAILRWLDPRRHPLLVQAPESEIPALRKEVTRINFRR